MPNSGLWMRCLFLTTQTKVCLTQKASAQNTLSRILEENAEELEDLRSGMVGGAKHLKLRKTDLDEWQVNDFILKNTDVIHTYAQHWGGALSLLVHMAVTILMILLRR